ncbi:MAG: FAD-dependent oxidoreductase [Gammaproteobacteria bacterium]|nr:FAD-dependent oxidoreductase [Gammaproteobacteria bacterium]MCH9717926.1 FAD-dependent oxidoreductase [Gammaproteobacteria bacterium]MCH9763423.1 FAD-dependent oxidoreductase [Gammaproteobacteria bacterium]
MSKEKCLDCDIAIIGGGAGGLSLAAGAAQLGAKVILVESGKMGGDCLNYGCVPSKALLEAAQSPGIDFSDAMQRVSTAITALAEHDSVERFERLGVQVIQAPGRFVNQKTLMVGDYTIQAKRFVVATGSSPFVPPIPGLEAVSYETNETIFNLKQLPKHLIIIGGGPIGCELAEAFTMLGSKVTILEGFKLLSKDDADAVDILRTHLSEIGVDMYEGIQVKAVKYESNHNLVVQIEQEGKISSIEGTNLLVSTGRRAHVAGLGLDEAGVIFSEKGIQVDKRLRCSNKKIYAMGDVVGLFQFTHVANYHAGIVLRNLLFKLPAKVNYDAVPWVTYTSIQIAHVGLLLEEAEKKPNLVVTEAYFSDNDKAVITRKIEGKIKVITRKNGCILGVTITGRDAGELILPWVIAIREKKSLRTFTDTIVPYPTLSEISKRVAGEFYKPQIFSNKMRCLVRGLLMLS